MKKYLFLACSLLAVSCGSENTVQNGTQNEPAQPPVNAGRQIFINNCLQCHNVKTDKIGPKLEGALAHWNNDTARIRAFIRNSQEAINSGDPRAVEIYKQWNETLMTPMPHLSDNDINELLDYIGKGVE